MPARVGVHGHARRLVLADARGVHLVHGGADVDRPRVDEVEHGGDGQRRGRGRGPFPLLDEDVGYDTPERGEEDGFGELRLRQRDRGGRALGGGGGGPAGRLGRPRIAVDTVEEVGGDDPVRGQGLRPLALAAGSLGGEAGLVALRLRRLPLVLGQAQPSARQRVLEPQEHLPGAHARPAAVGEGDDAATDLRRQLGAPAGLDRPRPRVRHRLLDPAPLDGHRPHRHPLGGEDGQPGEDGEGHKRHKRREASPRATDLHGLTWFREARRSDPNTLSRRSAIHPRGGGRPQAPALQLWSMSM